jgi:hypothetical protein
MNKPLQVVAHIDVARRPGDIPCCLEHLPHLATSAIVDNDERQKLTFQI